MIWGYHYFWKHPYIYPESPVDQTVRMVFRMIYVKDSRSYQWAKFGLWTSCAYIYIYTYDNWNNKRLAMVSKLTKSFMETWQGTDYPSGKSNVAMESSVFFSIREIHLQRVHFPSSYVSLLECVCHVFRRVRWLNLKSAEDALIDQALSDGTGLACGFNPSDNPQNMSKWDHLFPINLHGSLYYQPKHCTIDVKFLKISRLPYICIKFEFPQKWVPLKFPLF